MATTPRKSTPADPRTKCAGTTEYQGMIRRCLRKYPQRVREGVADINSLEQLKDIQAMLDEQMRETVAALRSQEGGAHSWAEIGRALGIARGTAAEKFGPYCTDDARKVGGQPARLR